MGFNVVVTYVVKPEKQAEFMPCMRRIDKYARANPSKFKEWKSFKLFSRETFDIVGKYMELWEFKNMTDYEKCRKRLTKDKGWKKLMQEIVSLIEPATIQVTMWNTVM